MLSAEIIYISSSESNSTSAEDVDSWANYFPEGWVSSGLTKEDARRKKAPFHAKEPSVTEPSSNEPSAKDAFAARAKVLGLPSATFCKDHGIKTWSPKIPKACSKGKGKKPMA